uniref:Vacuolar protein sorting-associated protein 72 homolog n=1 Tax=Steinernema glaseri TaxID=37863 RepID=A0A1I7YRN7_9BILA
MATSEDDKELEKAEESVDSDEEMRSASEEDEEDDEEEGTSEEDEEEQKPPVEMLATSRSRRATAGNKMAQLMKEAIEEQEKDDFYKTTYNGLFLEDDQTEDQEFQEPVESDGDEVDSDFDRSEDDQEQESETEAVEEEKPRKRKAYEDARNKSKKWVMARMGGATVPANVVTEKQQQQLMKEAEKTEKENVESLKKYEKFELEKKKKREKALTKHRVLPPLTKLTSNAEKTVFTVPEIPKFEKTTKPAIKSICAVTGAPARFFDPVTNLPYSTPEAFKIIRKSYFDYLMTVKGNSEVDAYLAKFDI